MAFLSIPHVSIRGISACVPSTVEDNHDLPFYSSREEADKVIEAIGIERRHVCPDGVTTTDLCLKAVEKLLEELGWDKESVDLLAYCTQCPDYCNHPNSFVIHDELGLPDSCMCVDYYHGCPGWVTALSSVTSMIANSGIKRAILLSGDMCSQGIGKGNREERPLFGDCGTATAIEYDETAKPLFFNFITKSAEGKALICKNGGMRHPFTLETFKADLERREGRLEFSDTEDKMDSMDVFSFAITSVPKTLKQLCANFNINIEEIDKLVLHQANALIAKTIAKKMKMDMERVPLSLREYGNTTVASVPMTIASQYGNEKEGHLRTLACGFGTGLACAAVYFETDKLICPDVLEY